MSLSLSDAYLGFKKEKNRLCLMETFRTKFKNSKLGCTTDKIFFLFLSFTIHISLSLFDAYISLKKKKNRLYVFAEHFERSFKIQSLQSNSIFYFLIFLFFYYLFSFFFSNLLAWKRKYSFLFSFLFIKINVHLLFPFLLFLVWKKSDIFIYRRKIINKWDRCTRFREFDLKRTCHVSRKNDTNCRW